MNATLQCLSNTAGLTDYFLTKYKYNINDKNKLISNEYYMVIKNLWNRENHNKTYSPNLFKNALVKENTLFEDTAQKEPKDLIEYLFLRLHQELNTINGQEIANNNTPINISDTLNEKKMFKLFVKNFQAKCHSIISDLFYGVIKIKNQCQNCNNIKYEFQIFSILDFPLEEVNKYCFNNGLRNNLINTNNNNPDINIYECFNYYGYSQMMTGNNQMYCDICKQNSDALCEKSIYSAPNYLIINLNRGKDATYNCNVIIPRKLNILNFVSYQESNTYFELYAVICRSMNGDFVAYCKNKLDKKWYKYSDTLVTQCAKKDEYKSGIPYVLFYQAL